MRPETIFIEGDKDRPLAVFIHGIGMNMKVWSNPREAKILGGKYPLSALLYGLNTELDTSFSELRRIGFSVLSWSQSRPVGPIDVAVRELQELMREYKGHADRGILFICHSRGGLIARKYLECADDNIKGLITLATPHHGTTMARWAVYLSPLTIFLDELLKNFSKRDVESAASRILGFLNSSGLRELLPASAFYGNLKDKKKEGVRYVSVGGTNPDLLRAVSISLPELISRIIPDRIIPEEMRYGSGDGLVSAESSMLPYADEHLNFPDNHASILFDKKVTEYILDLAASF
ncbi:MAG: alpha/beta hydrolase [Nitrospirae bacterium]|nr:alpha/beta hydrolase [Nitrospirota bacterium]